jgi:LCP family protein required for cell wall assembly
VHADCSGPARSRRRPGVRAAVGFSVPRDDWVHFAGTVGPQQVGKVDQAYGVSMYFEQARLRQQHAGMGQDQLAFLGNEAGRRAAVATVEKLTGVRIDHFAEVNLDGFYELAKVFGGVEVCLNHAVRDPKSGAHFHRGYQHLDAAQALSFVRQRDGLLNGDLDRTHRQQAFIDSVMHQLRTEGVLSDLTKVTALLSVAKQYVITDAGLEPARLRDPAAGSDQRKSRFPHAADQGIRDHKRPGRERGRRARSPGHRPCGLLPQARLPACPAPRRGAQ